MMRRLQQAVVAAAAVFVAAGTAGAGPSQGLKSNPGWVEPYTLIAACGRAAPSARASRGNAIADPCAIYMNGAVDMLAQLRPALICPPNGAMTNPANAQAMRRYLAAHPEIHVADGATALAALQAMYPCAA
jgi:hypothetical protein